MVALRVLAVQWFRLWGWLGPDCRVGLAPVWLSGVGLSDRWDRGWLWVQVNAARIRCHARAICSAHRQVWSMRSCSFLPRALLLIRTTCSTRYRNVAIWTDIGFVDTVYAASS